MIKKYNGNMHNKEKNIVLFLIYARTRFFAQKLTR